MLSAFQLLLRQYDLELSGKQIKSLMNESSEEQFIHNIEEMISNDLFNYHFTKEIISEKVTIRESFIIKKDDELSFARSDGHLVFISGKKINLSEFYGVEIIRLVEEAVHIPYEDVHHKISSMTPKVAWFVLALTPLVLITPFYANIFNSRLVYNNSVNTLLYITFVFLVVVFFEFFMKKVIKGLCLKVYEASAIYVEKYLIKKVDTFHPTMSLNGLKTIESSRKSIWELTPAIAVDIATLLIFSSVLVVFLEWLSFFLILYYLFVAGVFYFYRVRLYKLMVDSEQMRDDITSNRISLLKNNIATPYSNRDALNKFFMQSYRRILRYDDKITSFNFTWDEMVKMLSFISMAVLFIVAYNGVVMKIISPSILIALLILNGRLSSTLISVIVKGAYLKMSKHHMIKSLKGLFPEEGVVDYQGRVSPTELNEISLENVSLIYDKKTVISSLSLSLKKGVIYGVSGDVGSGKSTFLKSVIRAHSDYKGRVFYDGSTEIQDIENSFFEKYICYITPEMDFFPGSLYQNFVSRGCYDSNYMQEVIKYCFPDRPVDFEMMYAIDASLLGMSTGQKRLLLLYMACYGNKKVYVLDEAFLGVSPKDIARMFKRLRTVSCESIILIATHSNNILNVCDSIIEVSDGKVSLQEKRVSVFS